MIFGWATVYLLLTILTIIYFYFKTNFSYWSDRGVPYIPPEIPFGNLRGVSTEIFIGLKLKELYDRLKVHKPFAGVYFLTRPIALITDLDLVKNILIKDFQNFKDRHIYHNERDDPLSAHLFSIEGEKWKVLRSKVSPTFTSGRMKGMFPLVAEVGDRLVETIKDAAKTNSEIEIKDILDRFGIDVIGSCAFGLDCNSLKDPKADFCVIGHKMFNEPRHSGLVRIFMELYRDTARFLRMKSERNDVSEFFMGALKDTIEYREKNNVQRNDFLDLLIKLKNTGKLDDSETVTGKVTFNEIAAQAYVFFAAGFETSSTTLGFCLHEMAINQGIQDKAREEITSVIKRHDGKFTYDSMIEMTYIIQIISETLRKYPAGTELLRKTTETYPVPGTKHVLEKGTNIIIPTYAIQHDPEYFPNPDIFDPDRFTPENIKSRHSCSYLPFGDGPRNCVGSRFGKMQVHVGLVAILMYFKLSPGPNTTKTLTYRPKSFVLTAEGGVRLKFEAI